MGFSYSVIGENFPNILEVPLKDILLESYYQDVVDTKLQAVLDANSDCRQCQHFNICKAGCMIESMTPEGDFRMHDRRICHFHKAIGQAAARALIEDAITSAGYSLDQQNESMKDKGEEDTPMTINC